MSFTLEGPAWSSTTITWSLATFQYGQDSAHPFSGFIDPVGQAAYVAVIGLALDTWSAIGGFTFVELPDSGDPHFAADIRFGWADLLATSSRIGEAWYRFSGGAMLPDVIVTLEDPVLTPLVADAGVIGGLVYGSFVSTFYQIVLHEVGHALGLGHSTDPAAVMYPQAQGTVNQAPNASDIAGIAALYAGVPCFVAGTRILTADGPVAVESLAVGALVATMLSGRLRPVRWVGRRTLAPARHARPEEVMPVRIAAGAFGAGRPSRDLWLSRDHAVFAGGVLVPIRHLANATSIRPQTVALVTYFHVELAGPAGEPVHDVLLAEGLAVESFLDTGNRDAFAGGPAPALHPDFARRAWDASACAALHEGGPVVAMLRARLARRARGGHASDFSNAARAM
jgi:hypothetical protein